MKTIIAAALLVIATQACAESDWMKDFRNDLDRMDAQQAQRDQQRLMEDQLREQRRQTELMEEQLKQQREQARRPMHLAPRSW